MSVKDDAMTAVHTALLAASADVTTIRAALTAAEAAVEAHANALLQSQALADALKLSHGVLSGTTNVAPVAANVVGWVKKLAVPSVAVVGAALAFAHWGLKLF